MARRSKSKSRRRDSQRDYIAIAKPLPKRGLLRDSIILSTPLLTFQDNRSWSPNRYPIPMTVRARPAVIQAKANFKKYLPSVTFSAPKDAVVCVRRKIRKEVLFAKGSAGSSRRRNRPHYNFSSTLKC